ncbi:MAG: ATP-dependent helicase [Acidobacteria bacterium]|nr:ATP-dependent helicase [Acidobacteriota bacterium]
MNTTSKVTVALGSEFLSAFARIPRGQQGKVLEFVSKFRSDPTLPGLHYEKIAGAKDPNLRSVRIDKAYRGIALKPDEGNVFVLLWVDHHDEAYRWAANKICRIHPGTGSLQVISVEESEQAAVPAGQPSRPGLFDAFKDKALTALGVPELLLPLVRSIKTEEALDKFAPDFPQEAAEALYMLAAGYSLDEVRAEMQVPAEPKPVDTKDFEAALEQPDSKRRFFVVENEQELAEVLNAPLEKWRVFLHPSQRQLVEKDWNGPVRVLGGAGTGKTVVAMHRTRWLATNKFTGKDDRILFTTFTRNLAADIHANLQKICPEEAMKRIEVVNLDRWVSEFLKANGYSHQIVYGHQTKVSWDKALTIAPDEPRLDATFYREEWDSVVQPQSIDTLEGYMKASRIGRGTRLSRQQRKAVWPVFEEYRVLLNEAGQRESLDAMRDAKRILEAKATALSYRAVVVDEGQDMGTQAFELIAAMLSKKTADPSLFIVGDAHQRIYRQKVVLSRCGIDIRGRGRRLKINYRTTEEIRRWAVHLLEGQEVDDLDGGLDERRGYRSLLHGIEPKIENHTSFEADVTGIVGYLRRVEAEGDDIGSCCLVTRTNELLDQYEAALREKGIETYRIKRSEPENRRAKGLRLATMHRVKGLEFDRVIIAAANDGLIPLASNATNSADAVVRREAENHERALLYVAATRARRDVVIASFGKPSRFLEW